MGWLTVGVVAVSTLWALALTCGLRALTWDELEYARAADWVSKGMVPYRDFFEHHSPLQWFLMAPIRAVLDSNGVATVIGLRLAQIPIWGFTLWLLWRAMKGTASSSGARTLSIALLLTSPAFVLSAIEFRVDTVASFCLVLALYLLVSGRSAFAWGLAGTMICLGVLANLRIAPTLVILTLVAAIWSPGGERWQWNRKVGWLILGGAATLAIAVVYLLVTGSFGAAWFHLIVANRVAEASLETDPLRMFRVLGSMMGLSPAAMTVDSILDLDVAGLALAVLGIAGCVGALRRIRSGGFLQLVAVLQIANVAFIFRMKAVYPYHFQTFFLLSAFLAGALLSRWFARDEPKKPGWSAVLLSAILGTAICVNLANLAVRNGLDRLRYQNSIMMLAHDSTGPDQLVWDGTGWAPDRQPAYKIWFLPVLARQLVLAGLIDPYTPSEMMSRPPAAIIVDDRIVLWLLTFPDLAAHVTRHYLPVQQHLWLPGLSHRLEPEGGATRWTAPMTARYRVYASNGLAWHPWFRNPLATATLRYGDKNQLEVPLADGRWRALDGLRFSVDGSPVDAFTGPIELTAGDLVELEWDGSDDPIGVMLVPEPVERLFQMSPPGLDLRMPRAWEPISATSQ